MRLEHHLREPLVSNTDFAYRGLDLRNSDGGIIAFICNALPSQLRDTLEAKLSACLRDYDSVFNWSDSRARTPFSVLHFSWYNRYTTNVSANICQCTVLLLTRIVYLSRAKVPLLTYIRSNCRGRIPRALIHHSIYPTCQRIFKITSSCTMTLLLPSRTSLTGSKMWYVLTL